MSQFDQMPYIKKENIANSKPLGIVEVGGQKKEYYIPTSGVPDLYVEGMGEPVIKVEVDFVPGEGWKATDLLENPKMQDIINQISQDQYKYYVEEVQSYIRLLNQTKPDGV